MKLRLIIALCALLAVNAAVIDGNSFCNAGTCSQTTDCDLGVCCGGTCVESYPILDEDASCDARNPCNGLCPLGQNCESGKCSSSPAWIGMEAGCSCGTNNSQCSSNVCHQGKCLLVGLSTNDRCTLAMQCKSDRCENGRCVGLQEGDACTDTQYSGDCALGLVCSAMTINSTSATCVRGAGSGASCNITNKCALAYQSCIGQDGTCQNWYSGEEGDNCNTDIDCRRDLVCNKTGVCVSNLGEFCGADARCPNPLQTCECDGEDAICQEIAPLCEDNYAAYVTCVQQKCKDPTLLDNGFPHADQCIYDCVSQYAQWQCCAHCKNNNGETLPGLDCSGNTKKYVPPAPCCDIFGNCEDTPGKCTNDNDDGSSSGQATAGADNSAGNAVTITSELIGLGVALAGILAWL